MVQELQTGPRMYDVIGYRLFEEMLLNGSEEERRWLSRVGAIIENLDPTGADKYDARVEQLEHTILATARLLRALADTDSQQKIVLGNTLTLAAEIERKAAEKTPR